MSFPHRNPGSIPMDLSLDALEFGLRQSPRATVLAVTALDEEIAHDIADRVDLEHRRNVPLTVVVDPSLEPWDWELR